MHKGFVAVFLTALVVVSIPGLTSAQQTSSAQQQSDSPEANDSPSATESAAVTDKLTAEDIARLKDQLREEVKAELREELREALKDDIKAEKAAAGANDAWDESSADDSWAEEEWKWEEPAKPELNFVELDGYFRFRYDMFNNLDLGTFYRDTRRTVDAADDILYGPFAPGFAPPTPLCTVDTGQRPQGDPDGDDFVEGSNSCANTAGTGDTLGGANMRLRLEPTLNVYEDIKIKAQIDILDNIILGSTPDTLLQNPNAPVSVLSNGQVAPVDGFNSIWTDSIRVKRVWAEVMTPLGQIRVGRMPNHFGAGTTDNDGRGLDTDFGDTVDRILFATKIGDFYVIPSFDWAVSGPSSAIRLQPFGQPFDRDQRDDVDHYMLTIVRRDTDEEIKRKLENDDYVLNYGARVAGRFQALDSGTFFQGENVEDQAQTTEILDRDSQLLMYSVWAKFMRRNLTIEIEHSGIWGTIGNSALSGDFTTVAEDLSVAQFGGSARLEYRLLNNAMKLELLVLAASGDSSPGWGLQPLRDPALSRNGIWDGNQAIGDNSLTNFRFDPDYFVDLIFWRQLVGAVTDALVVRPSMQYNFTDSLGLRVDLIYSRAWFSESTPSGSFIRVDDEGNTSNSPLGDPDENLGIEGDVKIFFDSSDGLHAWLQYGLFIPLGGLAREVTVEDGSPADPDPEVNEGGSFAKLDPGLAHTFQVMLGITF